MRISIVSIALTATAAVLSCGGPQSGGQGDGKDGVDVKLCDNHTTVNVKEVPRTREEGQKVADALMAQWQLAHKDRNWEAEVRRSHPRIPEPFDNSALVAEGKQGDKNVYGSYSERDVLTWKRETERLVLEGASVFHDGDALGSTIAVSCDMCHPDASNTHPETYPKFQVQMGQVVLLRDMINWCLQHPVRAEPMDPDDPRMRAMEAYIMAQRSGTAMQYGKH